MRVPVSLMVIVSAVLLLVFSEFSQTAAIPIILGSGIVLLAYWNEKRLLGLAGFLTTAIGIALTVRITDLTESAQLLRTGFLLILPTCLLLWCALAAGTSKQADPAKRGVVPYFAAAAFGAGLLAAVPVAGNLFPSMRLSGDEGIQSSIILIGFAVAILSTAILGRFRD